jgi:hypothetical protein
MRTDGRKQKGKRRTVSQNSEEIPAMRTAALSGTKLHGFKYLLVTEALVQNVGENRFIPHET